MDELMAEFERGLASPKFQSLPLDKQKQMREFFFEATTGHTKADDPTKLPLDILQKRIQIMYSGTSIAPTTPGEALFAAVQMKNHGIPYEETAAKGFGTGAVTAPKGALGGFISGDPIDYLAGGAGGLRKGGAAAGASMYGASGIPNLLAKLAKMGVKGLPKPAPGTSFFPEIHNLVNWLKNRGPKIPVSPQKALPAFGTYPKPAGQPPTPPVTGPITTPPPQTGAPTYPAPGFPTTRPMAVDPFAQARAKVSGAQGAKELNPFLDDLLKQIWASKNLP